MFEIYHNRIFSDFIFLKELLMDLFIVYRVTLVSTYIFSSIMIKIKEVNLC